MPERDYSVMPVLVLGQERVSLARPVRNRTGSTQPGTIVDVEFGVTWDTSAGKTERIDGTWRQCRIVRVVHSELIVELLDAQRTTLVVCRCNEGWLCEDHPDQPLNHDDCGGAGMPCDNPECPWKKPG